MKCQDVPDKLKPAFAGKTDIDQDYIRQGRADHVERFLSASRLAADNKVGLLVNQLEQPMSSDWMIIQDENCQRILHIHWECLKSTDLQRCVDEFNASLPIAQLRIPKTGKHKYGTPWLSAPWASFITSNMLKVYTEASSLGTPYEEIIKDKKKYAEYTQQIRDIISEY